MKRIVQSGSRSALPEGWILTPLRKLGKWQGGSTPSKENPAYWNKGKVLWITPKDMKRNFISDSEDHITSAAVEEKALSLLPSGCVLIVTRSGILRHTLPVAINQRETYINQDLKALAPNDGILAEYVAWGLRAFEQELLRNTSKAGTTVNSLNFPDLMEWELPLAPPAEQRRIVEELEKQLSRLDAAVEALRRAQRNLARYRDSVLKAACEGKLVPTEAELARQEGREYEPAEKLLKRLLTERRRCWEEAELAKMKAAGRVPKDDKWKAKYKEPTPPETKGLPELPEGWCWATPDQLSSGAYQSIGIGPFGSNLKVEDYRESGVPLIFVRDVRSEVFGGDGTRFVETRKADELSAHIALPGDILITKMGEPPGDSCVYPLGSPKAIITADCIKLRVSEAVEDMRGLFSHFINSRIVKLQISQITKGVAQKKVSLDRFRRIALPLPPLREQQRLLDTLNEAFSRITEMEKAESLLRTRLQNLRQSLLRDAFSGKLVPQDPNDEPANALLERIQGEHQAGGHNGKEGATKRGRKKRAQQELSPEVRARDLRTEESCETKGL